MQRIRTPKHRTLDVKMDTKKTETLNLNNLEALDSSNI